MGAEHFKFKFTVDQVRELLHGNKEADAWYEAMCEVLPLWQINTVERVAGFVAQCAHESAGFKVLSENLNYSADGLNKIFPKYFKNAGRDANAYARQPEKIANVVYSSRMGNGDEASGDGFRYRGRGLIQLTGKSNYLGFAKAMEMDLSEAVDYIGTKKGALDSAAWFWDTNNINKFCDAGDIVGMTKKINGGTIGLEDRKKHFNHAIEVLGSGGGSSSHNEDHDDGGEVNFNQVLKEGSRGPLVQQLQEALGLNADGDFGPGTKRALQNWQAQNGLSADGVAGPKTLQALLG